jgi:hypothetical protein
MSDDDFLHESLLTRQLHERLSDLAVPKPPALAVITGKGRVHRRRRHVRFAGLGVTGLATGTALAFGLVAALGAVSHSTAANANTMQNTGFVLTADADGTDTLTLAASQMFDAAALQQVLVQHGIPALVKTDSYCWSTPAPPNTAAVLSAKPPAGSSHPSPALSPGNAKPGTHQFTENVVVTVINPAAMPPGAELFFGYLDGGRTIFFDLIYTASHTCGTEPPPNTP